MSVPFVQYVRPHGSTRIVTIDLEPEIEAKAQEVLMMGWIFDVELVPPNLVCFNCMDGEDFVGVQICPNGPPVVKAVGDLIEEAFAKALKQTENAQSQLKEEPDECPETS